jgi:predicted RNase H-like HicB family nuclease
LATDNFTFRDSHRPIEFHLEGLREEGFEIPEPSTYSSFIDIAA